jgi:hypothetical protein
MEKSGSVQEGLTETSQDASMHTLLWQGGVEHLAAFTRWYRDLP